jgi:hypothetical protein
MEQERRAGVERGGLFPEYGPETPFGIDRIPRAKPLIYKGRLIFFNQNHVIWNPVENGPSNMLKTIGFSRFTA